MNIALIGATGYIGSYILTEALSRGHQITAIVTHPEKLPHHQKVNAKKGDVFDEKGLSEMVIGHDAVISAFSPKRMDPNIYDHYVEGIRSIICGVKKAQVKRFLIVGGAGSLTVESGVQLVDTPDFPKEWKKGALATREALQILQKENALEWTFFSPAAFLEPGRRTGKFRLGSDHLIADKNGESRISTQDYAMAMIDELESPKHVRRRFTIGY